MSFINIKRIRLVNYKAFVDETIQCNANLNIFVGDNGTGKSSILQAIDLTLSGSSTKVDSYGIENIQTLPKSGPGSAAFLVTFR